MPRRPRAQLNALKEAKAAPPTYSLIDRRNPLLALPSEERAVVADYAKPEGRRLTLPPGWRQIVATVCARTWTAPVMARALGMSRAAFQRRLKEDPELAAHIAECDDHLVQRLVQPLVTRALDGDANLAQWLLERLDPARFGARPTTAVQVNNVAPPAAPLSLADYQRLLAESGQPPAIEHDPAPKPPRALPADAPKVQR